jgi:hypothetical protein
MKCSAERGPVHRPSLRRRSSAACNGACASAASWFASRGPLFCHDRLACPLFRRSDLIACADSGRTAFPDAVPEGLNFLVAAAVASNASAMATSKRASCVVALVAVAGRVTQMTHPAGDVLSVMHLTMGRVVVWRNPTQDPDAFLPAPGSP